MSVTSPLLTPKYRDISSHSPLKRLIAPPISRSESYVTITQQPHPPISGSSQGVVGQCWQSHPSAFDGQAQTFIAPLSSVQQYSPLPGQQDAPSLLKRRGLPTPQPRKPSPNSPPMRTLPARQETPLALSICTLERFSLTLPGRMAGGISANCTTAPTNTITPWMPSRITLVWCPMPLPPLRCEVSANSS